MVKLHLGCGDKIIPGFINVDIRPNEGVDIIDNISELKSIEENSIELIYACHVLEHFNRFKYLDVLKRWYELLQPGGILRLSVPDIEAVFEKYSEGYPLRKLWGFLYGGQTYKENYHYIGLDYQTLSEDLKSIGFKNITNWDWSKTEHSHIDDFSQAYIPHMDKENGKLMSLNIEATK